ncbi:MAG: tetratricopeptide repeat protein [Bacteroidaceae bacterium]|nr:tetratricopeptide repeat protein [Bacteroidaceae bacterium]
MRKILYIFYFLTLPLFAMAQEGMEGNIPTKELGDSAYSQGDYDKAVNIYESVLADQGHSVELYYNLGNAYFRSNMLGKAILNYERALRLDPTDDDVKANLEYALDKTKDELAENYEVFLVSWLTAVVNIFNINIWATIGVVSFVILLLAVFVFLFNGKSGVRKTMLVFAIFSLFVTIFANASALHLYNKMNDTTQAIVMREEVSLKSTPDNSGTVLIKIHEGRKVNIVDDTMNEWKEVELEDGTVGWLQAGVIERI